MAYAAFGTWIAIYLVLSLETPNLETIFYWKKAKIFT